MLLGTRIDDYVMINLRVKVNFYMTFFFLVDTFLGRNTITALYTNLALNHRLIEKMICRFFYFQCIDHLRCEEFPRYIQLFFVKFFKNFSPELFKSIFLQNVYYFYLRDFLRFLVSLIGHRGTHSTRFILK